MAEHSMDERLAALLEFDQGSLKRGLPEYQTIIHILNELLQRVKRLEEIHDRRRS